MSPGNLLSTSPSPASAFLHSHPEPIPVAFMSFQRCWEKQQPRIAQVLFPANPNWYLEANPRAFRQEKGLSSLAENFCPHPVVFSRQTQTDCDSLDGGKIADWLLGALCALAAELAGNTSKSPKRCAAQLSGGLDCRSALPNTKAVGFSPVSVLYKLIGCPS